MNAKSTFVLATFASLAVTVSAQAPAILYLSGKAAADQHIGLRSWGSGSIRETNEAAYEGTTSISVSSRNLFQGGIMMYANPVDLSQEFADNNNLLRITFRVADSSMVFGPGGGDPGGRGDSGGRGGFGPQGGGGVPPSGGPGGPGAQGGAGFGRGGPISPGGGGGAAAPATQSLKQLRMIVTTTDGKKGEIYIPVSTSMAGERGWRMVSIPLQAIRGLGGSNKTIKELAFSADSTTTLYIGDMRVVNDSTKIAGEIVQKGPINLALGDELNLSAYGFGGSSPLKFTWDFDAADGIQVDAEGQTVKRKFRKAGHYKITLTVGDQYGLKAPATSTLDVTINP